MTHYKVGELIERLHAFDPNLPVVVDGYEFGVTEKIVIEEGEVEPEVHNVPWAGEHSDINDVGYLDAHSKLRLKVVRIGRF